MEWNRALMMIELRISNVVLSLVAGFSLALSCSAASGDEIEQSSNFEDISIVALLADPEKYDGHRVAVRAWGIVEFEHSGIYLSDDDPRYLNFQNGIWLDLSNGPEVSARIEGYLYVEGRFLAGDSHRGYRGRLETINRLLKLDPYVE